MEVWAGCGEGWREIIFTISISKILDSSAHSSLAMPSHGSRFFAIPRYLSLVFETVSPLTYGLPDIPPHASHFGFSVTSLLSPSFVITCVLFLRYAATCVLEKAYCTSSPPQLTSFQGVWTSLTQLHEFHRSQMRQRWEKHLKALVFFLSLFTPLHSPHGVRYGEARRV